MDHHIDISPIYDALPRHYRELQNESTTEAVGSTWEMIYVGCVLLAMFAALLSDKIGADMVMLAALTMCMVANIITVTEGVSGFSNEGVLTVLVLFVVAAGLQVTGGLDWYMGKLLGRPTSIPAAQIRLMLPIMCVSAFLNNTPVVVVMIPIVQKWGRTITTSPAQLLIPLSFASILGGTCTLIGTSTNLVVQGLLLARYPDDRSMQIGLFDLGEYGIPVALIGTTYILFASPYLLPGSRRRKDNTIPDDDGSILLGARLTKWSPAAGRSVKRSGLRDTGGIYLVSVYRAETGNVHRAVGQQFVLNVDDILYFTGMVEGFASFCQEHGLEVVTNELNVNVSPIRGSLTRDTAGIKNLGATTSTLPPTIDLNVPCDVEEDACNTTNVTEDLAHNGGGKKITFASTTTQSLNISLPQIIDTSPGSKRNSLVSADLEKKQAINRISDFIRGEEHLEHLIEDSAELHQATDLTPGGPAKIIVIIDTQDLNDIVTVGVNAHDRPGLLQDISGKLHLLGLQLHHTEAAVVSSRSFSVWRCELFDDETNLDADEILASLKQLLQNEGGYEAMKLRGLSVIRAIVTEQSSLAGKSLKDIDFRCLYKGAIIAVQRAGKSDMSDLSRIVFASGDILVIQAEDDSPLLVRPPEGYYNQAKSNKTFLKGLTIRYSKNNLKDLDEMKSTRAMANTVSNDNPSEDQELVVRNPIDLETGAVNLLSPTDTNNSVDNDNLRIGQPVNVVWRDLRVLFPERDKNCNNSVIASREYLTAMKVAPKSAHINKTVAEAGLDKLTGIFIVQVERHASIGVSNMLLSPSNRSSNASAGSRQGSLSFQVATNPVSPLDVLEEGDIIWFAGNAAAIADLRKIPGLVSSEDDELKQINETLFDRRLVQAVINKKGPLVGKTAAEVGFRTRYGAAVIAVHRDGTRVQDHPGKVKLQAGDVLLLEAGPTFIANNQDNQHSFALISEVKDSKPPRLNKLIPAAVMVVTMLALVTAGISSLLILSLLTCMLMVACGIISQQECRDSINWDVYVTIASAFGLGIALTNSGLANLLAEGLVNAGEAIGIGVAGLYGAVYLATFLISNVVTNNAAAALMFPIAMEAAEQTNADPLLMSYNLMLAASASFMSPFGYTTNLLIYGPGGYTTKDFLIFGTPLQIILWVLTTAILSNTSTIWYLSWIWTFAVFFFTSLILVCPSTIKAKCYSMKGEKERHSS